MANSIFSRTDFLPSPHRYAFWCEFDNEESPNPFTGTALSSGTIAVTTDEEYGVATLSGAATTDNSGYQLQSDMEAFAIVTGKEAGITCRVKLSDGTQDELFVGASITDTTMLDGTGTLAGGMTMTDSFGFYKPDGSTLTYGTIRRDSVQLATGGVAVDFTSYKILDIKVQPSGTTAGSGKITFYVDGVMLGSLDSTTLPYSGEEILALALAFVTGDNTGTKTCKPDYIGAFIER